MSDETLQSDMADGVVEDKTLDLSIESGEITGEPPFAFGRYRITGVLGRGGFGTVYRGFDEGLRREVAIKVPHRQRVSTLADAEEYLVEAQTVANLDHPHIVPVFDVGVTAQFPCFIVSKYIDGTDLAARLKQSRLSIHESVELVATVAEALHHAHKQGLVHRDVKPGNILLDKSGKPFVADFGLALRERDAAQAPSYAGTPAYMSPEQARGEGHRVDARSDVFSLGVVFYELLAGRKPFRSGSQSELLNQIATFEPRPPRQHDECIPKELDRICLKALSKRVSERYSTARDMAEDLRLFLAGQGGSRPQGPKDEGRGLFVVGAMAQSPSPSSEVGPAVTAAATPSDSRAIRVMPKGLRSFDAHDADFFLDLLPGPRDREGLPESIRFWKSRIEEKNSDETFTVGLIYGPSGCGKSSLVKAGLLTRLSNDVVAAYVEATAEETETRLLNVLRRRCPALPAKRDLTTTMAALRRGQGLPAPKKVLIVLDQFEQWLHARNDVQGGELVAALRQCDGVRLQCIVMVRDDFWLALSRFMRALEIDLVQGKNMALVDLFDLRHAKKVLASFGRAFGTLPEGAGELRPDEEVFLDQAVSGLAQAGKVISVRLSLFAEMVKSRPWTPATLEEVGGMEGVGLAFLDETFAASTSAPQYRVHRKAAQAVLRSLVPETGTDIKGKMRSERELLAESGYAAQPDHFAALMRILDGELRLITPTDPEDETSVSAPGPKYYQLTHDYLVHSLREWLTRTQRATRRGRAELLLGERSAAWNTKPDVRFLPGWLEWPNILIFTNHRKWTTAQRRLMRAARKYHGLRLMGLLAAVLLALFMGLEAHRRAEVRRAEVLAESVFSAPPEAVRYTLDNLSPVGPRAAPVLRRKLHDAKADPAQRLHAAFALAELGEAPQAFLLDSVPTAPGDECRNLVAALQHVKQAALPQLGQRAESAEDLHAQARLAIVALQLGEAGPARQALALRSDPNHRTALIHDFAGWHGDVAGLAELLAATADPNFRSGLCAALGTIHPPHDEREKAVQTLAELYTNAPDGGTHSAAGWALRQWEENLPALPTRSHPKPVRDWFVNGRGMTMIKVPAASFSMVDLIAANSASFTVQLTKPFYVCDREVWVDLFREFVDDASGDEVPSDWKANYFTQTDRGGEVPVQLVKWGNAVRFCNWLSRREGRRPCYGHGPDRAADTNTGSPLENWQWDRAADGYRLPTEAEWEYACRAGAATAFSFGDDPELLEPYAVYGVNAAGQPRPGRQKLPNACGLFDMHGNVAEWCYDWYAPYPLDSIDPFGPAQGTERVFRGGSYHYQSAIECGARLRSKASPDYWTPMLGFRVVVSEAAND